MIRQRPHFLALTAALALAPLAAAAQDKPTQDGPAPVEGVIITAPQTSAAPRTSIDRRSYDLKADIQGGAGSLSDALRNIPSVQVDGQGAITLRGDSNVTILIDGKPAPEFKGDGAAAALASLPADQIERVEVITNPSASVSAEGSAGVINLITRRSRGAGPTGSVRASIGDRGQYNLGVSGGYNTKALALTGDVGFRRFEEDNHLIDNRTTENLATGEQIDTLGIIQNTGDAYALTGRIGADYELGPKDRISAGLRGARTNFDRVTHDPYESRSSLGGAPIIIDRAGITDGLNRNFEATAGYRRKFDGEAHELAVDLRRSAARRDVDQTQNYRAGAPAGGPVEAFTNVRDIVTTGAKAEYKAPLAGMGRLVLGLQSDEDASDFDDTLRRGPTPATLTPGPDYTSRFSHTQRVNAAYATYQRPLGDLTVLAGLRFEDVTVDTLAKTTGEVGGKDYSELYPSLHLSYAFNDAFKGALSYGRRVVRPSPFNLNPARQPGTAYLSNEGNPDLGPQFTDAFEGSVEYRKDGTSLIVTLYSRRTIDVILPVFTDLGGGMISQRSENVGENDLFGAEVSANGRLTPQLTYSLSGNVYRTRIEAMNLGFPDAREATTASGRASLDWQATPKDTVQVSGNLQGKFLAPQGYQDPMVYMNLAWRHSFSPRLSTSVTVKDVFDSFDSIVTVDSPWMSGDVRQGNNFRAILFGLTYSLGGGKPREPAFEFGGGSTG